LSVKAELLSHLQELKKKALEANNVEAIADIDRLSALIETEGKKIVEKPAYRVHLESCLLQGEHPKTQQETRTKMKECAKKWSEMSEEDKKKIRGELELRES
jgi:hypothetical protein